MKVDVYYNLRKKCLSIRSREKESYGKVIKHSPNVLIKNAVFVVQPAGLKKARDKGVKNVHAFVRGELVENPDEDTLENRKWRQVYYDPFKWENFVTKTDKNTYVPMPDAKFVRIFGNRMFASGTKIRKKEKKKLEPFEKAIKSLRYEVRTFRDMMRSYTEIVEAY